MISASIMLGHIRIAHKSAALDALGSGNLVREVREIRHTGYMPYLISRRFDYARSVTILIYIVSYHYHILFVVQRTC